MSSTICRSRAVRTPAVGGCSGGAVSAEWRGSQAVGMRGEQSASGSSPLRRSRGVEPLICALFRKFALTSLGKREQVSLTDIVIATRRRAERRITSRPRMAAAASITMTSNSVTFLRAGRRQRADATRTRLSPRNSSATPSRWRRTSASTSTMMLAHPSGTAGLPAAATLVAGVSPMLNLVSLHWAKLKRPSGSVSTRGSATYHHQVGALSCRRNGESRMTWMRPAPLVAVAGLAVATSRLFLATDSATWLFAARGLQGLATGTALGAAGAALLLQTCIHTGTPAASPSPTASPRQPVSGSECSLLLARPDRLGAARSARYLVLLALVASPLPAPISYPSRCTTASRSGSPSSSRQVSRRRSPPLRPRGARGALLLDHRRALLLARPGVRRAALQHRQRARLLTGLSASSAGAVVSQLLTGRQRSMDRYQRRLDRPLQRNRPDRRRRRERLARHLPRGCDPSEAPALVLRSSEGYGAG